MQCQAARLHSIQTHSVCNNALVNDTGCLLQVCTQTELKNGKIHITIVPMENCGRKIVIGAIMKDEAPYIIEWAAYHRMLGFDLIIADNGGLDETSSILQSLHHSGYITRLDFRNYQYSPQIPAYRAIVRMARRRNIEIAGFLDADEFFTRHYPLVDLSPQDGAFISRLRLKCLAMGISKQEDQKKFF